MHTRTMGSSTRMIHSNKCADANTALEQQSLGKFDHHTTPESSVTIAFCCTTGCQHRS